MPLLRKSKRIKPLLPKQPDKVKLLLREELGKPLPLNKELRQLDSKLKKDVENKQLLVKELMQLDEEHNRKLPQLDEEPNRKLPQLDEELPQLDGSEFAEDLVEFAEPLKGLENLDSVGLGVGFVELLRKLENLDSVGLDVGFVELLRKLENLDSVGLGVGLNGFLNVVNPDLDLVADAVVSLLKHPSNFKVVKCVL